MSLVERIAVLRRHYGKPPAPDVTDPFELALWVNGSYLVDDERRAAVHARLRAKPGFDPQALLDMPTAALAEVIAEGGMHPDSRAIKLQRCAELALEIGLDVLRDAVRDDPVLAKRLLKKFPGFGDPCAELALLLAGRWKGLAPDSNVLRVLLRLGYGIESSAYAKSYRSATQAVEQELRADKAWLIAAHQLLRTHGQQLCKNTRPRCEACPLAADCRWYAEHGPG